MGLLDKIRRKKVDNSGKDNIIATIKDSVYIDGNGIQSFIEKDALEWNMIKGIKGIEDFGYISCDELGEISVKIDDVSQFDLDKLDKLARAINIKDVTVFEKEKLGRADEQRATPYNIKQYREVVEAIEKIKNDIEIPAPEDKDREYKLFSQIYIKLAGLMEYNEEACNKQNDKEMQTNARNLYGGLINGKAVCGGYAEILRNMCCVYGIECNNVVSNPIGKDCHAFNQVCINGKWYNCDLTFDQEDIVNGKSVAELENFLKSDNDFIKHEKDKIYHTPLDKNVHICKESYIIQTKESNNVAITKGDIYCIAQEQKQRDISNGENDIISVIEQENEEERNNNIDKIEDDSKQER